MKIKSLKRDRFLFYFKNPKEFELLWQAIFEKEEYKIDLGKTQPLILDVGAHIGLATIYFKNKYPQAKIIAFEPNPETAKLLRLNIKANQLKNVKVIEAAIWNKEGKQPFYIDSNNKIPWTGGDSLIKNIWGSQTSPGSILVKTIPLSTFLNKSIDLLKIDVEGVENLILKECAQKLYLVKNLILEYHETSKTNQDNKLASIVKILEKADFKLNYLKNNNVVLIKGIHES
ncbi:FkbM family methyltransferase [Patescibacteria group bacterium]|nr:FkbM family methyltransferase [Patescibacteria group bacterium]